MGWFEDNEDYYISQYSRSPDRSQLCRNGLDCSYAAMGSCWFLHPDGQKEKPKQEKKVYKFKIEKWEDWSEVNLEHRRGPVQHHYGYEEHWEFGEDYDEEEESEEESSEENSEDDDSGDEAEEQPCKCSQGVTITDPLVDNILDLPPELQIKILQKLDLTSLLSLQLSPTLFREVLRVPREEQLEQWIGRELFRQDLGIIYIPGDNSIHLSNDEEYNNEYEKDFPLHLEKLSSGLEHGFYKVRELFGGFDLVKLDHHFLTSLCGPQYCFPSTTSSMEWAMEMRGSWDWSCNYGERGFTIDTEHRDDLAAKGWRSTRLRGKTGNHCQLVSDSDNSEFSDDMGSSCDEDEADEDDQDDKIAIVLEEQDLDLTGSMVIISTEEGWWRRRWAMRASRSYCKDDVSAALSNEWHEEEEQSRLSVITSQDGGEARVVAYILSNNRPGLDCRDGGFHSFDPNQPSLLEHKLGLDNSCWEKEMFSIIRYGYQNESSLCGFSLTGDCDYYRLPREEELQEEGD
eukprot:GFUD01028745.1.p1 GENE.GFUD01028745.1~~GFUD01028745.1.p1  ORF type:complete len:514 (-),score=168.08 GFUD01028745.1:72-1613(-)